MENAELENLLVTVEKPGRYIGGEWNAVKKAWAVDKVKILLAFPDAYEIGMSHLGTKILYGILNERADCLAERAFSPWPDFEEVLRKNKISLFSLESRRPLKDFDIIGFSLAHELTYTNTLNILDLGSIPLKSSERGEEDPLIIAGGPSCCNPEPMAEFIDAFVIGDGEEVIGEIVEVYKNSKLKTHDSRPNLLKALAKIKGIYVPSLYKVEYNSDRTIKRFFPIEDSGPPKIEKRLVKDLGNAYYPTRQIVPNINIVHDRIAIEVMRGCKYACRFCQARTIYGPYRERSMDQILRLARATCETTGYDEISLLSLSSASHSRIKEIIEALNEEFGPRAVSISVPSLRIEDILKDLPRLISKVKKAGLTFAPEAGSERLRKAINKNINLERLFEAALESYKQGWRRVKLYFMIGLPEERDDDILLIGDLISKISNLRRRVGKGPAQVTVSINTFLPKPATDFERHAMDGFESLERKKNLLKSAVKSGREKLDFHSYEMSFIEAALSRGDRRVSDVIYEAWERGARFDGWQERFNFARWLKAFEITGIDPNFYVTRKREPDELLPWSFIDFG